MDISQQFLIDMALNIGGYVLAGLVGVVVYSLLHRRRESALAVETAPAETLAPEEVPKAPGTTENRRLEFIKLGERSEKVDIDTDPGSSNAVAGDRRNRSEIIRIARTMLKAGASEEKIKRLIPISDAELSLLSMSKS